MERLQNMRKQMDGLDQELTQIFLKRLELSAEIGAYKKDVGLLGIDPERELEILQNTSNQTEDENRKLEVAKLYETILSLSRREQRVREAGGVAGEGYRRCRSAMEQAREVVEQPRVVYQGVPGAYGEMACLNFFGSDCPCRGVGSFEAVLEAVERGEADYGVLPIENSSTGGIRQVYELLGEYEQFIVGETTVKVEHCLMAGEGATLETITHVYSHEQGLFQSERFLKEHPSWIQVPYINTAQSCRYVAESGDSTKAAIGSVRAAELYGLKILVRGVNYNGDNTTRFAVIAKHMERRKCVDKISALLSLPHQVGSLNEVLTLFAVHGLNLVKLESRPLPGRSWEYLFFVDFSGDLSQPEVDAVILELSQVCSYLRILGNYKSCI